MANDRLYIRCRGCGALCLLAKHFGYSWTARIGPEAAPDLEPLEAFFQDHHVCRDGAREFDLITESEIPAGSLNGT